ncbi:S9 family peptidase [Oceanobacillus jeddahense]|uniref:S9 family peptidase n=1 Tax=Oceanobacillus jeddahense TaxID=1462527 RepID=A0ABY5K1S6_9BACI|nr:S9 family peptidase [Oceanobacillus jeddahense]UUI05107.1 S9 family peptidase [Oceanobacillus jeddahense]
MSTSQEKRALTATDFQNIKAVSEPEFISEDTYSYVVTSVNADKEYESQVFVHHLTDNVHKQWTTGNHRNHTFRVSPNKEKAFFLSDRSGTSQIWLTDFNGGEAKKITTFPNGVFSPVWSNDGKSILFCSFLEKDDDITSLKELSKEEKQAKQKEQQTKPLVVDRLKYKSDARGFHDHSKVQIIQYDVTADTFHQLTSKDSDHHLVDLAPDNKHLIFAANLEEDADASLVSDLYLLELQSKEITKLTDSKGSYHNAKFSRDSKQIVVYGHEFEYAGATLTKLFLYDLKSKERKLLSGDWSIQPGDTMVGDMRLGNSETGPVWSSDNESIYFIGSDYGAVHLYETDLEGNLKTRYSNHNHLFGFSYHPETESFILGISHPTDPCNFYKLSADNTLEQLTDVNKSFINDVALSEPEEITFTSSDGLDIQGWLLRPYGFQEGKKYPFVLEVHGGPHAMYGQTFFHELQLLAARGYVVLYTNPRGSHGYGQDFVNGVRENYGKGDYQDLMEAVDYCIEQFSFIDETRLGVTGGSYGGFMTNWIVGHTNRFKAAVTQRSISNWLSFYGVSDIGFFFTKWEHGVNLMEDPTELWDISPLKYAENVETPLLILHGEKDYRCPIEQGEQLFITLKHLNKEVEFVRFPNANHELSRSGNPTLRVARLENICRWFEKYL